MLLPETIERGWVRVDGLCVGASDRDGDPTTTTTDRRGDLEGSDGGMMTIARSG